MNKYLMSIRHYFSGYEQFIVEAENKQDAIFKGLIFVKQNPKFYCGGNYNLDSIKCIKKLQRKTK